MSCIVFAQLLGERRVHLGVINARILTLATLSRLLLAVHLALELFKLSAIVAHVLHHLGDFPFLLCHFFLVVLLVIVVIIEQVNVYLLLVLLEWLER